MGGTLQDASVSPLEAWSLCLGMLRSWLTMKKTNGRNDYMSWCVIGGQCVILFRIREFLN